MQRYFNREKHLDGICEFLLKNLGMAFCDECLRTALGTYRSVVPERSLSERAAARGFVRKRGICVSCGQTLMLTKATAGHYSGQSHNQGGAFRSSGLRQITGRKR